MKKKSENIKRNQYKKYFNAKTAFKWLFIRGKGVGNKGIAIVGVLTASAIGLIVLAGTTQMLLQLTSRIGQHEGLAKRKLFYNWLAGNLQNPIACSNTLGAYTLKTNNELDVGEVRDTATPTPNSLIDFYDTAGKKRLKDEFGIDNFDRLTFTNYDSTTNEAQLVLYTKNFLHGTIPIYDKSFILNLTGVNLSGGTPNRVTGCSVDSSSIDAVLKCLRVYEKLSLVGCGTSTDITSMESTSYGHNAGSGSSTGEKNTFIGLSAGAANTTGEENTFVGHQTGAANTTGEENIFLGSEAGKVNTTGSENTFAGFQSGAANTTGAANTFVGYQAGTANTAGGNNVFIGAKAGISNTTGSGNTFIGMNAGATNTTGDDNIFIGHGAAPSSPGSNIFVVGNGSHTNWINGTIGTDIITINGKEVCLLTTGGVSSCPLSSSRVYKKNIKEFKDFEKSLQDILNTPLFTYQYKENHPEKSRMGVISEELPESLQIKVKGTPSRPDWPSIYGTLWAGIKSFSQKLTNFNLDTIKMMEEERLLFSKELDRFKKEVSLKSEAQSENFGLIFKTILHEWENRFDGGLKGQLKVFKGRLSYFKNWFEGIESRLKKVEELQVKMDLLGKAISSYRVTFKAQQKQIAMEKEKFEKTGKALLQAKEKLKKKKEILAAAKKRLSDMKEELLKSQMKDREQFEIYDKKLKQIKGKLKTFAVSF